MKKVIFTLALSFSPFLHSAELPSASTLLEQIEKARGSTNTAAPTNSQLLQLRADLTNFIQTRATLSPAQGAAQWLALLERARTNKSRSAGVTASEILAALPDPSAWPQLESTVSQKEPTSGSDLALRIITARLVNQTDKARPMLEAFSKKASESDRYLVQSLQDTLDRNSNQSRESLLKQLDRMAAASARGELDRGEIPRLAPTLTEAEAEEALKKVLPKIKSPLTASEQSEWDYVWKAALAVVNELSIPQWGLVQSHRAAPLFEALEKKFGGKDEAEDEDKKPSRFSYRGGGISEARKHYLVSLLKRNEIAKAVQAGRQLKGEPLYFDHRTDQVDPAALAEFYSQMLKENPALPWWDEFAVAAAHSNRTADALKLAEDALQKSDLTPETRASLRLIVAQAKLADDKVDEGLAALRELAREKNAESQTKYSYRLALLGAALKRPELLTEALQLEKQDAETGTNNPYSYANGSSQNALLLAAHGLPAEALELAAAPLMKPGRGPARNFQAQLAVLATIYVQQNRAAEALTLLERSPDWGVDDLVKLMRDRSKFRHGYFVEPLSIAYIAAAGLAAANRPAEARTVLNAYLQTEGGDDRAYELLLKLDGEKAIETLDALFAVDRFEERPLIWEAVLQQRAIQLEAAEQTIRRAIAIDPSDGEQGPGDRLRAYAVLADIREARDAKPEAEQLRNAVKAIRLSEEADLDYAAGLLRRALRKYRESITLFADAYCVQARLAVQMAALGLHEDAETHYRRAFELMPDSFGRVESHCFGCEGAFGGDKAQNVAEKIFTDLLAKTPNKPQLHYLLGYLRNQQGRQRDAVPHLRQAVALDPDYLNAWKLLSQISERLKMTPQEVDDVTLNILRLDPAGRHGDRVGSANDLARLWKAIQEISDRIPEMPAAVFKLPASAEALAKRRDETANRFNYGHDYDPYYRSFVPMRKNPAVVVAQDSILASAGQMLVSASGSPFD